MYATSHLAYMAVRLPVVLGRFGLVAECAVAHGDGGGGHSHLKKAHTVTKRFIVRVESTSPTRPVHTNRLRGQRGTRERVAVRGGAWRTRAAQLVQPKKTRREPPSVGMYAARETTLFLRVLPPLVSAGGLEGEGPQGQGE